jgi:hypothetical protein
MGDNIFMPKGLPLLSDAVLIKTSEEYRHAHALLQSSRLPLSVETRVQVGQAIEAIESELQARGVSPAAPIRARSRSRAWSAGVLAS